MVVEEEEVVDAADAVTTAIMTIPTTASLLTTSTQETKASLQPKPPQSPTASLILMQLVSTLWLVCVLYFYFSQILTPFLFTDGGYQNYLALWYQSYAQNAATATGQGDATKPPGTS